MDIMCAHNEFALPLYLVLHVLLLIERDKPITKFSQTV